MKLIKAKYAMFLAFLCLFCALGSIAESNLNVLDILNRLKTLKQDESSKPKAILDEIDDIIDKTKQEPNKEYYLLAIALKTEKLTKFEYFQQADSLIQEHFSLAHSLNVKPVILSFQVLSLRIQSHKAITPQVIKLREELIKKAEFETDLSTKASIYKGISYSFYIEGDYRYALQFVKKAYQLYVNLNNKVDIAEALVDLGNIYLDLEDYKNAITHYQDVIELHRKYNNQFLESIALYNLGRAFFLNKDFNEAKQSFNKAIALSEELDDELGVGWAQLSLATILIDEEKWAQALLYFQGGAKLFKKMNNKRMHLYSVLGIVQAQSGLNNIEEAEQALKIAEQLSDEINELDLSNSYLKVGAKLYVLKQDYFNAYQFEKKYGEQSKEIFEKEKKQNVQKYRIQFETELKENQNKILLKENQLKKLQIDKQEEKTKYTNTILFLALLIILIFMFMLFKQIQHRNRFKAMALKDHLTNSPNRRAILDYAQLQFDYALKHQTELSIGIIDLDFFKKINDTYGHDVGDEVLKSFALACKKIIRKKDKFGRYGGEEWLFVLPDTNKDNIQIIFERLRNELNSNPIKGLPKNEHITFSMGVAEFNQVKDKNLHDLILRSDNCLYRAKDSGRNTLEMESL